MKLARQWLKGAVISLLILGITLLHFLTSTEHMYLHQIYQRGYYIPIVLASFWFEIWGGVAAAVGLILVYLVHILRHWAHQPVYAFQQYAEIAMYLLVAVLAGYLSRSQRQARERFETAATELSVAYSKLNETFYQLRHAERLASLGRLSAGIAHEIRNPLSSIQGAVEILGDGLAAGDPRREFAQIARREIAGLNKLVTEILQFSRPAPPRPLPTDASEIIDAARRLCADRARSQGVEIVCKVEETLPRVQVDPEQIKQVVLNLLINALEAQPHGGRIVVRAYQQSGDLLFSVQDSGPGIEPEHLDDIFEPFFTTKREGTGLGLSISHQLVRNNSGEIRVSSPPGQGACFVITFPVAGAAAPANSGFGETQ